jgi:acyl carrier protein
MAQDTAQRVLETVQSVIMRETDCRLADVQPASKLVDLGADSLEMADLMLELEEALGVEILSDDLKRIFTIQDIVNYAHTRSHA